MRRSPTGQLRPPPRKTNSLTQSSLERWRQSSHRRLGFLEADMISDCQKKTITREGTPPVRARLLRFGRRPSSTHEPLRFLGGAVREKGGGLSHLDLDLVRLRDGSGAPGGSGSAPQRPRGVPAPGSACHIGGCRSAPALALLHVGTISVEPPWSSKLVGVRSTDRAYAFKAAAPCPPLPHPHPLSHPRRRISQAPPAGPIGDT